MPLTKAICTSCGGALEVDSAKDAAICPYCGTPYIVEKAIQQYNTMIQAGVVNVFGKSDYEVRAGKLEKYNGSSPNAVIPEGVAVIGAGAFENCSALQSVVIPDTVNRVEERAFKGCSSLRQAKLPQQVTHIGKEAFSGCCSMTNLNMPEKLVEIGEKAFWGCTVLQGLDLPAGLRKLDREAFSGCESLNHVVIPGTIRSINFSAVFLGCHQISSIVCLPGVEKIYTKNWRMGNVQSFSIPDSVTTFENLTENYSSTPFYKEAGLYGVASLTASAAVRQRLGEELASVTSSTSFYKKIKPNVPAGTVVLSEKSGLSLDFGSFCYVATAVYGSYDCPEVWTLRRFRDQVLAKTAAGRSFIRCYYRYSPFMIHTFGGNTVVRSLAKAALDRWVAHLRKKGFQSTCYSDQEWHSE